MILRALLATILSAGMAAAPAPAAESSASPAPATASPAACVDAWDLILPNESCSPALPELVPDGYVGLVVGADADGDRDWYRIVFGNNQTLRAEVIFRNPTTFSSLALYASCAGAPILADSGSGTTRVLEMQNTGPGGTYWLLLRTGDAGICHMYDMAVSLTCPDAFDPNEYCDIAAPIGAGSYPNLWIGGSQTDQDYFKVHLLPQQRIVVDLDFVHAQGNLNTGLFSACFGELLAASLGTGNHEHFEYLNPGAEADFILLVDNATNPSCTPYTMTIAFEGGLNLDAGVTPAGWDFPTVPRGTADASPSSARVPAVLPGNQPSTFLSQYVVNEGPGTLPAWTAMLLVDGEPQGGLSAPDGNTPGAYMLRNFGPVVVRGGRHTAGTKADYYRQVAEPDTTDNLNEHQFVWSPLLVPRATSLVRPAAPLAGAGVLPNADGFEYTRDPDYAWVFASAARGARDCYPLVVYDDYEGSAAGFSQAVGSSDLCAWMTNFVVGHFDGTPAKLYPAVTAFVRDDSSDFLVDASDSFARVGGPSAAFPAQELPENRLADVYEAYIPAGLTVSFALRRVAGTADLEFEVFPAASAGVHGRTDGTASAASSPELDLLAFTAPQSGYYPVVVFRSRSADATAVSYDLRWSYAGAVDAPAGGTPVRELSFAGLSPNPLTSHGRFRFTLPAAARVALEVFDAGGRRVATPAAGEFAAGWHDIPWDARAGGDGRVASGVYWARLETGGRALWRRFVVLP